MTWAYVVTSGEYSDYSVLGVFSTRERGDAFCAVYNASEPSEQARIEVFALDTPPDKWNVTNVHMQRDGTVLNIVTHLELQVEPPYYYRQLNTKDWVLLWEVCTADKERAVKVVNEKRAQILAQNAWGDKAYLSSLLRSVEDVT